jgi:hypothetical protein
MVEIMRKLQLLLGLKGLCFSMVEASRDRRRG